ncbi:hypothetical protein CLV78_10842 [Aliiruegeria haliotis]|uniref:Uncharacterized protein n=1 Tax=Aliiruegeria haliotis TaxID=1280846 RepID=A0A2T0RKW6_9RHOB|nr:hypothetical protein CLV78_10842 [Aliiruegeria haliotis]
MRGSCVEDLPTRWELVAEAQRRGLRSREYPAMAERFAATPQGSDWRRPEELTPEPPAYPVELSRMTNEFAWLARAGCGF